MTAFGDLAFKKVNNVNKFPEHEIQWNTVSVFVRINMSSVNEKKIHTYFKENKG